MSFGHNIERSFKTVVSLNICLCAKSSSLMCMLSGQRSVQGALIDLKNALVRYWSNNFADGKRQDAIDLFLGHVDPKVIPVDDLDVIKGIKQISVFLSV
jgi:hypothetical protein